MKTKSLSLLILFFYFFLGSVQAQKPSAKELVTKSFNLFLGKSSFSVMNMTIVRPTWKRSVSLQSWSLGDDYYIIFITAPARDKGDVFMKSKKDLWNYIPAINRIIKIPPSMMMQSWMGSDFTNNDLMKQNSIINDYTHTIVGHENFEGFDSYVIELKPLADAAVIWGSIKMWIAKKNLNTLKKEFYDSHGKLVKTLIASQLKVIGGRMRATHIEMISNVKKGHKTILNILHQEFNVKEINRTFFSIQHIKSIRPRNL